MSHSRTSIHKGPIVDLGSESVTLPNGTELTLDVVRHPGGAAIVALDDRQQVCLLRQYRHAAGGWLWELPAGKLEPGEVATATALRELEEEAGLQASHWQKLGEVFTTPGFCNEVIHLFLAEGLSTIPTRHQENECIEVHWIPLQEALDWIRQHKLKDAKSILGLLLAQQHRDGNDTP